MRLKNCRLVSTVVCTITVLIRLVRKLDPRLIAEEKEPKLSQADQIESEPTALLFKRC
jgi:hypothetical protein